MQAPAGKGSGFHTLYGRSQNSSFTVIQLSLHLGLNLQKSKRHLVLTLNSPWETQ